MQKAFDDLSTDRAVTQAGPLAIPFTSIDRYAERYDIDDFDRFLELIRAMDKEYLDFVYKKD